jgi:hypothetical protein
MFISLSMGTNPTTSYDNSDMICISDGYGMMTGISDRYGKIIGISDIYTYSKGLNG